MRLSKRNREVFIVRIWREAREGEGRVPEWRGVVESVHNGERRYVKDLDEIGAFIVSYLDRMGVRLDVRWRVRRWLNRRKESSPR